jgi:amino acid efflux transporter
LIWLFVGWEAVAQLVGDFRRPAIDLPRAMALAFGLVTVLYAGLAVATIGVTGGTHSRVPLADIVSVGFGHIGRDATAVLAVALTMGTMNVYYGGAAKLAASLAQEGALPRWLAGDAHRSVPRRPLVLIAGISVVLIAGLVAGFSSTEQLVRATSACFIAVYVLAIGSAIRILRGRIRIAAFLALILTVLLGVFSAQYLAVPAVVVLGALLLRSRIADDDAVALDAHDRRPRDLVVPVRPDPEPVEHAEAADAQRDHLEA